MSATKNDVAKWMVEAIRERGFLDQEDAVMEIEARFGAVWIYENENGNPAIDRKVLAEFRKLKPEHIEWDNSDKSWS